MIGPIDIDIDVILEGSGKAKRVLEGVGDCRALSRPNSFDGCTDREEHPRIKRGTLCRQG
jgi:hypothetical protein